MLTIGLWPCIAGATAAGVLSWVLFWKRRHEAFSRAAILVMGVLIGIHVSNAVAMSSATHGFFWRRMALLGEIALPVSLSYLSLVIIRPSTALAQRRRWRLYAMILTAVGLSALVIVAPHRLMLVAGNTELVFIDPWGRIVWGGVLLGLVLALSDLEHLLRGLRDPLRYQLKYVIIGFGGLAGVALAQATQLLLLPVWNLHYAWVSGLATVVCVGLIGVGFTRWRVRDLSQKVHISHRAVYTSLTFFLVGGYLVVVGLVAEVVRRADWAIGKALSMLLVFVAAVGLVSVAASRQARMELKHFIARNFFRSKHDYRAKWLEMTEAFAACETTDHILDQYLIVLSQTFGAPRIGIWLRFDVDGRYHQVRTVNTEPAPYPLDSTHPLIKAVHEHARPIQFAQIEKERDPLLREFLHATQAVLCVPMRAGHQVIGFVTLSSEAQGAPYEVDDVDLCRAMAYHVTMLLIQAQSTAERTARAKWDSVAQFSAFYLHDLKNLASGLSLVVQNAEHYGQDPEFHASVIRTVAKTANRITELMEKLSVQLKGSGGDDAAARQVVDLNVLIQETLELVSIGDIRTVFELDPKPVPVAVVPEQLKQVFHNLFANARQALQGTGTIEIRTEQRGNSIVVTIRDDGPGIPASRLATVFHPFQSTKQSGMGIGLYQCKQIIERHHGSIRIESREGEGTSVIITLPRANGAPS